MYSYATGIKKDDCELIVTRTERGELEDAVELSWVNGSRETASSVQIRVKDLRQLIRALQKAAAWTMLPEPVKEG